MVMGIEEGTEYLPYYLYFQDVTLCHDRSFLSFESPSSGEDVDFHPVEDVRVFCLVEKNNS